MQLYSVSVTDGHFLEVHRAMAERRGPTLRTADSTNLHATHSWLSRRLRLPLASGAYRQRQITQCFTQQGSAKAVACHHAGVTSSASMYDCRARIRVTICTLGHQRDESSSLRLLSARSGARLPTHRRRYCPVKYATAQNNSGNCYILRHSYSPKFESTITLMCCCDKIQDVSVTRFADVRSSSFCGDILTPMRSIYG